VSGTARKVGVLTVSVLIVAGLGLTASRQASANAVAYKQGTATTTNGTALSLKFSNPVTAGDFLVGIFSTPDLLPGQNPAVTDSLNQAWTKAAINGNASIWYHVGAAAGVTTVSLQVPTIHPKGSYGASIAEYLGAASSSVVSTHCLGGSGTRVATGYTSAVPAGDLVFAGVATSTGDTTVTSGSSNGRPASMRGQATSASDGTVAAEDVALAAAGTQNATMNLTIPSGSSVTWNSCGAVFGLAGGHNYYWGAFIGPQFLKSASYQTESYPPHDWGNCSSSTSCQDCVAGANTSCSEFERYNSSGKGISLVHVIAGWTECAGGCPFPDVLRIVRADGVIPLVDWGSQHLQGSSSYICDAPADAPSPVPPGTTYTFLTSGDWDTYITNWAVAAKAWQAPFFLRFNYEMNDSKYFDSTVNSVTCPNTTAGDYVAAWKHVHGIFDGVAADATVPGALKVSWVWCPGIDPHNLAFPLFDNTLNVTGSGPHVTFNATSITDTTKNWANDQWKGAIVSAVSPTNGAETRSVQGNNANTLTLSKPWTGGAVWPGGVPASGSTYVVNLYAPSLSATGSGSSVAYTSSTTITDSSKHWGVNEWKGATVSVGAGAQIRTVQSNSAQTLTLAVPLTGDLSALPRTYNATIVGLYPGDAEVDWTGLDGYNRGGTAWTGFAALYYSAYFAIHEHFVRAAVAPKPMVLAELGSTSIGGTSANGFRTTWVRQMFMALATTFSDIYALTWFDFCTPEDSGGGSSVSYSTTAPWTVTDSAKMWTSGQWAGQTVSTNSGVQTGTVATNGSDSLTLTDAGWAGGTPGPGSPYVMQSPPYFPLEVDDTAAVGCTHASITQTGASTAFAQGVSAASFKANVYAALNTSPIPKP
jgi:hypothetical protein